MEPTFTLPHVPALVSQLPSLETRSRSQFLEHCTGMQRQNIKDIIIPNLERFLNIKSSMEEALKYQREFASLFKREGAVLEERAMQLELELPSHVEVLKNELASLKNSLAQRQQQPSEQQPSAISWGEFSDDHSYLCPDDLFGNNKSLSPLRLLDETEETKLSFSPPRALLSLTFMFFRQSYPNRMRGIFIRSMFCLEQSLRNIPFLQWPRSCLDRRI